MSEDRIRSFIAVDIDDQRVLDSLRDLQRALGETGAEVKLVEVDNLHVTIRFLGDVSQGSVDKICGIMDEIEFQSFDVELREVGVFPSMTRVNVVWVGIERGNLELLRIFNQLEQKLEGIGFKPDGRGFSPHITVARVRSGRKIKDLADAVSNMKNMGFGVFNVNSVKLKKSDLTPKGPIYSTLHEARAKREKT